ncbi:MAG: cysteine hydrolase family protein [Clostridium sp.]|nr:cysteine hydrolase family protein [Clostridium sp.]
MKTGLLMIDIQNDYFKGGAYELFNAEETAEKARMVLDVFRKNKMPVFFIQHISPVENAPLFAPRSNGIEFYKDVLPNENEIKIVKHTPDSFFNTKLLKELKHNHVDHLVICGMMTHMCIDTTVRSAVNHGFKVTLIEDACTTRDLPWKNTVIKAQVIHDSFMAALGSAFAEIKSTDKLCREMREEEN